MDLGKSVITKNVTKHDTNKNMNFVILPDGSIRIQVVRQVYYTDDATGLETPVGDGTEKEYLVELMFADIFAIPSAKLPTANLIANLPALPAQGALPATQAIALDPRQIMLAMVALTDQVCPMIHAFQTLP